MRAASEKPVHPGRPRNAALAARRREDILRQAIRHFARDGYPNADLDAVAEDVGCAKGTLYRYFSSKCDLFHESVDLVMRELLAATASAGPDPIDRLEDAVRAYLAHFDAHPEYVELLIQERAEFRDRREPTCHKYRESHRERWRAHFHELMTAGRMRRMPVERALDVIGNLLYGTIFVNYFSGQQRTLQQQTADVLDVLFHALLTPAELRRRSRRPKARAV